MAVKVEFDAWCLSEGAAYRGVGTYARNILGGLAHAGDFDVLALIQRPLALPDGVRPVRTFRLPRHRWSQIEHEILLPVDLRRHRADVVFEPTPDPPIRPPAPHVQTLFDTIPLVRDDPDIIWARKRWQRYIPRYRRAAAVIAISRYSADEGIRVLGLDPRRVHVAHLGVDHSTFCPGPAPEVARPYVVMVNEYSIRKGFDASFAAIAGLADMGLPHNLRVGGRIPFWVRDELESVKAASPRPDLIELLDYVDDLVGLYRGASAAVVTSHHEGFGLPALEAMACGIPVVAWANTATTEVVGDGGILVQDGDVPGVVDALARVLRNPGLAAELSDRAIARAAEFRWERCVQIHADVLRDVARRG